MLGLVTRQRRFGFVKIDVHKGCITQVAGLRRHSDFVGILKEVHNHVAFVACHLPLGTRRGVQHQNPILTFDALPDSKHAKRMLTRGVRAFITAHSWWKKSKTIPRGTLYVAAQFGGSETQNSQTDEYIIGFLNH